MWASIIIIIIIIIILLFNCGRQEEPAMLISRLLLRTRRMYVACSIRLDFHYWMYRMHRTQSDHARFDYLSRETYAMHSAGAKAFWPSIVVARTP